MWERGLLCLCFTDYLPRKLSIQLILLAQVIFPMIYFLIVVFHLGKPDPPTELRVLNATDSSVVLTWEPGFDGGLEQAFTVRYNVRVESTPSLLYAEAAQAPFTLGGE